MIGGSTLRAGAGALALVLLASVPVAAQTAPAATPVPQAKDGPLSPRLAALAGGSTARTQRLAPSPDALDELTTSGDVVHVDVRVTGSAALTSADALPGVSVAATTPDGANATLAVPTSQLGALGELPGVLAAEASAPPQVDRTHLALQAAPPITSASTCPSGTTVSAGSAQLKVPSARSTHGVDGTGVKIGIISDSYGVDKAAAASDVRAGNLPGSGNPCGHSKPVKIVADSADGTDEGRAMAQIVHDLAPGAELLFADAGESQIEMANHVRALRDAGARVIVDDISYLDSTLYQDGFLAAAVDEVVADGVTYLTSAGNMNLTVGGKSVGSYETQAFRPTTCPSSVGTGFTCHDFDPGPGVSAKDVVTIPSQSFLYLNLGWNEPRNGVDTDLDLLLLDDATGEILDVGGNDNPSSGSPIEWAGYENSGRSAKKVRVVVARDARAAAGTPRFKSVFYSPSLSGVQWNTAAGGDVFGPTLFGHAASPSAIAVGANTTAASPTIETFSTRGPATLCWEKSNGLDIAAALPGCTTKTVDLLATDGVATTVDGFNPFYGTSAAAPHAAAVAALMVQNRTCATPATIRTALQSTAVSMGSVDAGGSGRIDAQAALGAQPTCADEIGVPPAPAVGLVSPTTLQVTIKPPAVNEHPVYGYELQLLRPGGEVIETTSSRGGGPYGEITVDVPVEVGQAYRVRARTDSIVDFSPWSPSSALVVPPFSSATAFMNQLGTDFTSRSLTDQERQVLTFVLADDFGPAHAAIEASWFEPWGPKLDPVTRLFSAYFLRKPDPSGLNYWLNRRRAGVTLEKVSANFANSNEFKTRYGALSNRAFVELVYRNVLGRVGDPGGITYWTKQLDTRKKGRGQVMTGFSESSEYVRNSRGSYRTINLFFGLLRRVPTNDELATWRSVAVDDDGDRILAQHLITSPEYLARVS